MVGTIASASASSILGRAKGLIPGGRGEGQNLDGSLLGIDERSGQQQQGSSGGQYKAPTREKIVGMAVGKESSVWDDDKRVVYAASVSPW